MGYGVGIWSKPFSLRFITRRSSGVALQITTGQCCLLLSHDMKRDRRVTLKTLYTVTLIRLTPEITYPYTSTVKDRGTLDTFKCRDDIHVGGESVGPSVRLG